MGVVITVADNGKGIPKPTAGGGTGDGRGFGLVGIAERARLLGGSCLVNSTPGRGTTLTLTVRLSEVERGRQNNHSDR